MKIKFSSLVIPGLWSTLLLARDFKHITEYSGTFRLIDSCVYLHDDPEFTKAKLFTIYQNAIKTTDLVWENSFSAIPKIPDFSTYGYARLYFGKEVYRICNNIRFGYCRSILVKRQAAGMRITPPSGI